MFNQSVCPQDDSLARSVRVFLLGMIVAFLISISVSYGTSTNSTTGNTVVDCTNPLSLNQAQDQSRNGIANACL